MNSGRIDKDQLPVIHIFDTGDPVARGLGLVGRDRKPPPTSALSSVDLPDVRAADDAYKS